MSIVLTTTRFRGLAEAELRTRGAPWVPLVAVPHPLGGIALSEVREYAKEAAVAIRSILRRL